MIIITMIYIILFLFSNLDKGLNRSKCDIIFFCILFAIYWKIVKSAKYIAAFANFIIPEFF